MINFILGVIAGALFTVALAVFETYAARLSLGEPPDDEKPAPKKNPIKGRFSGKAEILEPISTEIEAMEAVIKANDKKGRDTNLSEL